MVRERSTQRRLRQAGIAGKYLPALLCALLPMVAVARAPEYTRKEEQQLRGDAQRHEQKEQDRERSEMPRQTISLDQAIAMAEQRYKARVVRADTTESGGRRYHVLRLLSQEGRVWTVRIDAATGQEH